MSTSAPRKGANTPEVTRIRLPSGEEKLVPSLELEKIIAERLEENGLAIRESLRKCRMKLGTRWQARMLDPPDE